MLYCYMVQGKGWSNPYVFAYTESLPTGSYVLVLAQRPGGFPGENYYAKGIVLETLTEVDADNFSYGRELKPILCCISEDEYSADSCQLSDREIKARQKRGTIR